MESGADSWGIFEDSFVKNIEFVFTSNILILTTPKGLQYLPKIW